jgi:hypothetical protein
MACLLPARRVKPTLTLIWQLSSDPSRDMPCLTGDLHDRRGFLVCMLLLQADESVWLKPQFRKHQPPNKRLFKNMACLSPPRRVKPSITSNRQLSSDPSRDMPCLTGNLHVSRGFLVSMLLLQADESMWLKAQFRSTPSSHPSLLTYPTDGKGSRQQGDLPIKDLFL